MSNDRYENIRKAQVITHWPDGTARDERDIASDPEGILIHDPSEPLLVAAPQPQVQVNDASVQPELVAVALATCDAVDDLIEKWYATRESECLPIQVARAMGASKLLRTIALEKENRND